MTLQAVDRDYQPAPHNLEVEQSLLGSILIDNQVLQRIAFLESGHFYEPLHQRIYDTLRRMIEGGLWAIPSTAKTFLSGDSGLQKVGGPAYLGQLSAAAVPNFYVEEYARMVVALSRRRTAVVVFEDFAAKINTGSEDVQETLDAAQAHIATLADDGIRDTALQPIAQASQSVLAHIERAMENPDIARGVPTGVKALDKAINGLQNEHLVILAARPGMGKSAKAGNIALTVGETGKCASIFTLEMSDEEYAVRMQTAIASRSGEPIYYEQAMRGQTRQDQLERLREADEHLAKLPIFINKLPALKLSSISAEAKRTKRRMARQNIELGVVIIDHMGLIKHSGQYRGKVEQVGEVSNGLKELAKDLDCAVVALCQLNREVEKRDDKRPTLSDLRWAGEIEQDADEVLFLYREHYYLKRDKPKRAIDVAGWDADLRACENSIEIIHAKQRMGPTGTVEAYCDIGANLFRDVDDAGRGALV